MFGRFERWRRRERHEDPLMRPAALGPTFPAIPRVARAAAWSTLGASPVEKALRARVFARPPVPSNALRARDVAAYQAGSYPAGGPLPAPAERVRRMAEGGAAWTPSAG